MSHRGSTADVVEQNREGSILQIGYKVGQELEKGECGIPRGLYSVQ